MIQERGYAFDILFDRGNAVAATWGLAFRLPDDLQRVYLELGLDLPTTNGDESWTLPMPARYIIDRRGIIKYARVDPDYRYRPEPSETLEALRSVSA